MKKRIKNVKRCKTYRYPSEFLKKGRELKSCQVCRNIATTSRLKHSHYRCEHGRSKYRCIECGGSSICEHKTQRSVCKICEGSSICVHKRQRIQCKICGDEIKITLKNMIKNSKRSDQEHDRYDANNFIDMCFLEGLVEEYPHCYWDDCDITLQFIEYREDLATIERLDNSIGHTKANCVFACMNCNKMKKSDKA